MRNLSQGAMRPSQGPIGPLQGPRFCHYIYISVCCRSYRDTQHNTFGVVPVPLALYACGTGHGPVAPVDCPATHNRAPASSQTPMRMEVLSA